MLPCGCVSFPSFSHNIVQSSGPQPFWHQGPVLWKTIFPQMRWGYGSGGNVSDGEQQMKLCLLIRRSPPAVRPGVGGVGDPWSRGTKTNKTFCDLPLIYYISTILLTSLNEQEVTNMLETLARHMCHRRGNKPGEDSKAHHRVRYLGF